VEGFARMIEILGGWANRLALRIGYQTLLSAGLLWLALAIFWSGMLESVRELRGSPGIFVLLLGVATGWLLGRTRLNGWWCLLLAVLGGLVLVFMLTGGLFGPFKATLTSAARIHLEQTVEGQWLVQASTFQENLSQLGQNSTLLLGRLGSWLQSLLQRKQVIDPVARLLFWHLLLWFTAAWVGWVQRRWQNPLLALTPAGALLGGILAYTLGPAVYMILYLEIFLVMQALQVYFTRVEYWDVAGIDAPDLRIDVGFATIGVSFALVTAAIIAPSFSVRSLVNWVQRITGPSTQSPIAQSLGLRTAGSTISAFQSVNSAGLARRHLIGSGPELGQLVVMQVQIVGLPGFQGTTMAGETPTLPPLYWRALTYDTYTGHGWFTSATEAMDYPVGSSRQNEVMIAEPAGFVLRQKIQKNNKSNNLLFHTGEILAADRNFTLAYRPPADSFGALIEDESYTADSWLPAAGGTELRMAGATYPEWVTNRYLQLPEGISARVINLAIQLTSLEPTPYDRAVAIENYLRTYPYTLDLPAPPVNREIADYFLFDLQRGYCDYYATAMVVLARAAGLPARIVVGYAQGEWNPDLGGFIVTEEEAHTWVEVYFPQVGWVEFEPTAGRPALDHTDQALLAEAPDLEAPLPPLVSTRAMWQTPLALLISLFSGGALFLFAWAVYRWNRLRHQSPGEVLFAFYHSLHRQAQHLGVQVPAGATPLEFTASLAHDLEREQRASSDLNINLAEAVRWVGNLYSQDLYSPRPAGEGEKRQALQTWLRLSPRLWLLRLKRWASRLLKA
jgi:transglutaminase-like putative cysteine protease